LLSLQSTHDAAFGQADEWREHCAMQCRPTSSAGRHWCGPKSIFELGIDHCGTQASSGYAIQKQLLVSCDRHSAGGPTPSLARRLQSTGQTRPQIREFRFLAQPTVSECWEGTERTTRKFLLGLRKDVPMSAHPPPPKPSDPDPHLPDPTRPIPTREPMQPPRETPAPKIDPPGPTPERPRRP
jgi:hypothetical protein